MKRKYFDTPLVFLTGVEPNADDGPGPGSDHNIMNALKPIPMNFEEWLQSRWIGDYDQNGDVDFGDYARWWGANSFGLDVWSQYNTEAWKDEWDS